jgi:hypothetical protein
MPTYRKNPGTERPYANERDEGGLRYRMNSASLRHIHRDQLESEGSGEYAKLFAKQEACRWQRLQSARGFGAHPPRRTPG